MALSKHMIGEDSELDADMQLIELFVRHKKDPNNYSESLALHTYYHSQLLNYWQELKSSGIYKKFKDSASQTRVKDIYNMRHEFRVNKYGKLDEKNSSEDFTNAEDYEQKYYPIEYSDDIDYSSYERKCHVFNDINPCRFSYSDLNNKTTEFLSKIASVYESRQYDFIMQYFDEYEAMFLLQVDNLNKKFEETKLVDLKAIGNLFNYISGLRSGFPLNYFVGSTLISNYYADYSRKYTLPNKIGLYGLNTFLYAFFNKVKLVGVPTDEVFYDGVLGSPVQFMLHDNTHVQGDVYAFYTYENLYYKILDSHFNKDMKELLITVLWIIVHEIEVIEIHIKDMQTFFNKLISKPNKPFIKEFKPIYLKYEDILEKFADEIKTQIPAFEEVARYKNSYYYYILFMLYGVNIFHDITNLQQ